MTIETKLEELRIRWKHEPQNRSTIEAQVKVLKIGEKYPKFISVENPFIKNIQDALM